MDIQGRKKRHIDTETRTTRNKSGAWVRGHTKTWKLVAVLLRIMMLTNCKFSQGFNYNIYLEMEGLGLVREWWNSKMLIYMNIY